jgi:adenylate kinase
VATRLAAYRAQTAPVIAWYEARGLITRIPALGAVEDVAARVSAAVGMA